MEQSFEKTRWLIMIGMLILFVGLLVSVVKPFVMPLVWALIITIASWPVYRRLRKLLPGRPKLAASIMTVVLFAVTLLVIMPLLGIVAKEIEREFKRAEVWLISEEPYQSPGWLTELPIVGPTWSSKLETFKHNRSEVLQDLSIYRRQILSSLATFAKGVLSVVAQFLFCLLTCFFLYLHGDKLQYQLNIAVKRIGGSRFGQILSEAKATLKGVVLGVLVTAFVQGLLAGLSFAVAGGPAPVILGFLCMLFSLIPFGTPLIYVPAVIYMIVSGQLVAGLVVLAWCVCVVSTIDNILRPFFISQATAAPLLLVLIGVLGGVISFGFIGIFIGPVIITVAQVLWNAWINPQNA